MQNILVSRTKNQAKEVVKIIENKGFKAFVEPLFLIKNFMIKKQISPEEILQTSFVIITSSNAIKALNQLNLAKNTKIFAVGIKTAKILESHGFNNVFFPKKSSALDLKNLIIKSKLNKEGLVIYLHGSKITLDFKGELKKYGFEVKKILAYETTEINSFSPKLLEFCSKNRFSHILLFSKNNAKTFFNLAKKHNLLEYLAHSQIVCLSEEILFDVKNFGFKNSITFADFPILKNFL